MKGKSDSPKVKRGKKIKFPTQFVVYCSIFLKRLSIRYYGQISTTRMYTSRLGSSLFHAIPVKIL